MKKILIVTNPESSGINEVFNSVKAILDRRNAEYLLLRYDGLEDLDKDEKDFALSSDFAIAIGGDGTILSAGRLLIEKEIPIFGINTGHLGYLASAEPEEAELSVNKIFDGEYSVEERVTLLVTVDDRSYYAINEAVFHRGEQPRLLKLNLSVNGQEVDDVRGDGLLISTPTGSTAYNLSAGGPVISPTAKSMAATPVCPHSLSARPIVLGETDVATVSVSPTGSDARLAIDGVSKGIIPANKTVEVKLSDKRLRIIRASEKSFYKTLMKKLSEK